MRAVYETQGGRCALCPATLSGRFVRDHRVPRALGGKTNRANLQLLCEPCDARKTAGSGGDIAKAAKADRLIRKADPVTRRVSRRPLKGRAFYKGSKRRKLSGEVVDR